MVRTSAAIGMASRHRPACELPSPVSNKSVRCIEPTKRVAASANRCARYGETEFEIGRLVASKSSADNDSRRPDGFDLLTQGLRQPVEHDTKTFTSA